MRKAIEGFFKALELIVAVLVFVLTTVSFFHLVSRYFLGKSSAGIDELTRLAFVWSVSIGIALAFRSKAHLGITALLNKVPPDKREYAHIFINVVLIVFFSLVLSAGITMTNMGTKQYSEYLRMSMMWFYVSTPISALLSIVALLEDIWNRALEMGRHEERNQKREESQS